MTCPIATLRGEPAPSANATGRRSSSLRSPAGEPQPQQ